MEFPKVLTAGDEQVDFVPLEMTSQNPMEQFKTWYETAKNTPGVGNPDVMCLATATRNGMPSVRYVLLRGFDDDGFKICTDYYSRKGMELAENPHAALAFQWMYSDADGTRAYRQVRIEGSVTKMDHEESLKYFCNEPFGAKVRSHICKQSQPLNSWDQMFQDAVLLVEDFKQSKDLPMPENWGGYTVTPAVIEFYQGTKDGINDRLCFRKKKETDTVDGISICQGHGEWVYLRLYS